MGNAVTGVVRAAEFERARRVISGVSSFSNYEEWLDARYARFMGLSLGGVGASLKAVDLNDFLTWCGLRGTSASEAALDDFALAGGLAQAQSRLKTQNFRKRGWP